MKKIWLLTTLLVAGLLLTGCNKIVIENPEIIDDCVTVDWEDSCAVDIDEPIVEEPTYDILDWTWYIWCPWWCEDWSDEEYVEWYLYQYTNPELKIRVTTPVNYKNIFYELSEEPLFEQYENGLYSIENRERGWWSYDIAESILMFEKDPSKSLEQLLRENLLKDWCVLEIDNESLSYDKNIIWAKNNTRYWMNEDLQIYDGPEPWKVIGNDCRHDKLWRTGIYVESEDWKRYYLINKNDWCAPWPCSIFWKIEIL